MNPWPPGLQSDGASNWATEAGMLYNYLTRRVTKDKKEKQIIDSKSIVYSLFLYVLNGQKAPGAQCIQIHLSQPFFSP